MESNFRREPAKNPSENREKNRGLKIPATLRYVLPVACLVLAGCAVGAAFFQKNAGAFDQYPGENAPGAETAPAAVSNKRALSVSAKSLVFEFDMDENLEFIDDAPFRLHIESGDPNVVRFEKRVFQKPSKKFSVPIAVEMGKTMINIFGNVYYCVSENGGQCHLEHIDEKVFVSVGNEGDDTLSIVYRLKNCP
jgi:hypothetical protein